MILITRLAYKTVKPWHQNTQIILRSRSRSAALPSHTPTLGLQIIKLSQTVGVISGYLVYKLGIIKETCCQTEPDIVIMAQIWQLPVPAFTDQMDLGMNCSVGKQIEMLQYLKVFQSLPVSFGWRKGDKSCIWNKDPMESMAAVFFFLSFFLSCKGLMFIPCLYLQAPTDMHKH